MLRKALTARDQPTERRWEQIAPKLENLLKAAKYPEAEEAKMQRAFPDTPDDVAARNAADAARAAAAQHFCKGSAFDSRRARDGTDGGLQRWHGREEDRLEMGGEEMRVQSQDARTVRVHPLGLVAVGARLANELVT